MRQKYLTVFIVEKYFFLDLKCLQLHCYMHYTSYILIYIIVQCYINRAT